MPSQESTLWVSQAPLAWYQWFRAFLLTLGFCCSASDTSLFVLHHPDATIFLLVYVDDIIITVNNKSVVASLLSCLRSEFSITDLGRLGYFLGLEVSYPSTGLFLSQAKYTRDILLQSNLLDSKPVSTPLAPTATLTRLALHLMIPLYSVLSSVLYSI